MFDWLTSEVSFAILVSGFVFYFFGQWAGFKTGAKVSSEIVIDVLIAEGYLKTRTKSNGELEIQKLNEDS